ncbi:MAG: alpha/beta hydrolase [Bacteroidota bacterium]
MRAFYTLAFFLLSSLSLTAQVAGDWFAILDAMGTKLPMQLQLSESGGQWTGTMLDPTKPGRQFTLDELVYDGKKLDYKVKVLGITFNGLHDGKEIRGVFNQANVDFPLTFTRHRPDGYPIEEGPITIRRRPQEPVDFPYQRKAVTFPGGAEGITLAGELTLPEKGKPKAVVVLVSGSGPQDRNAYLGSQINHSPFLVLSDYLTRKGYGVLRYDERGIAESTGVFNEATTADLAADAAAAVNYLRSQPEFKKIPIGMVGHSEGGIIAPMVSTIEASLDFVVLLAAPALPIDSLMLEQRRQVAKAMGVPPAFIERDEPALRAGYAFIKESKKLDHDQYIEGLYSVFEAQLENLPEPLRKSITDPRKFNSQYVTPLSTPWMRYFIAIDPQDYLTKLTIPLLAINGTKDTQVPAMDNLNAIRQAMVLSKNKDATVVPLLELNHLFQTADSGAPSEYGTIDTTFEPSALGVISDWLDERFK